jgi:hypothetical protein
MTKRKKSDSSPLTQTVLEKVLSLHPIFEFFLLTVYKNKNISVVLGKVMKVTVIY